jgi:hypothetical protein
MWIVGLEHCLSTDALWRLGTSPRVVRDRLISIPITSVVRAASWACAKYDFFLFEGMQRSDCNPFLYTSVAVVMYIVLRGTLFFRQQVVMGGRDKRETYLPIPVDAVPSNGTSTRTLTYRNSTGRRHEYLSVRNRHQFLKLLKKDSSTTGYGGDGVGDIP